MQATLVSIQVGLPKRYGDETSDDPMDKPWYSGFFKLPVTGPVAVGKLNIEGDGQADLKNHGGADKAILCYSADHYDYWREQLQLTDFPYGAFGENLTLAGIDETTVCIGDTWAIGDVQLQVSQPRQPCWKLGMRWRLEELPFQVIANGKSGWYVRVMQEGVIEAGRPMTLIDRPHPNWTVAEANRLMFHAEDDLEGARALSQVDELAGWWRRFFRARADRAE